MRAPRQQGRPTVGDTMTIVHRVAVPRDGMLQARVPTDSNLVTLVGPPIVSREGDSVSIAYTVTLWAPGHNQLTIPGPIVARPGTRADTLSDLHVTLDVASVLPPAQRPESIAIRPAQPWMPSAEPSTLPFMVLVPLTLVVLGGAHWWWRRRGPVPPVPTAPAVPPLTSERVEAWLSAGEGRVLLRHIESQLPRDAEVDDWRARADAVRYAPADQHNVEVLVREGWALLERKRAS